MLTDAELLSMKETLGQTLPDTCVIERRTLASDGQGGGNEAWAPIGTVDCRLSPIKRRNLEYEVASGMAEIRPRTLTVPADTTIEGKDRVVTGGVTYNVTTVEAPRSWEISRRAEVVEVK